MPSASLESLISPAMRIALGLEVTESEPGNTGDDSHPEDIAGLNSSERHARKRGTTTSEEEYLLDTGVDQENFPDKPSNICFVSQGWSQPNSFTASGCCDKVVRI